MSEVRSPARGSARRRSRSVNRSSRGRKLSLSPEPRLALVSEPDSPANHKLSDATHITKEVAQVQEHLTPTQAALWTAAISALAVPVIYFLDETALVAEPFVLALVGVVVLAIIFLIAKHFLLSRLPINARDPYISWFVLFAFTSIVDLTLAAEIDLKLGVFEWYLQHGERYLQGPYGAAINWWDATAHWALYIIMVYALCQVKPAQYRPVYLFWAGSIINSLFVLVPGAAVGLASHNLTYSTLLNIPYVFIPVWFLRKAMLLPRSKSRSPTHTTFSTHIDLLYMVFFVLYIVVSVMRFAVALGSEWHLAKQYRDVFDPILTDSAKFFGVQGLVNFYYFLPLSACFIFALVVGGSFPLIQDLVYIFAGAAAQSQFVQLRCGSHPETLEQFRGNNLPGFWFINLTLFIVPQLFAWRVWTDAGFRGLTTAVSS